LARDSTIAVIGAGVAGLTLASGLAAADRPVVVFDKGRGVGGRTSTRRVDDLTFDHGAGRFGARDPDFEAALRAWVDAGVVAPWSPRLVEGPIEQREDWVGVPRMSALARFLATDLDVRTGCEVARVEPTPDGWRLVALDDAELGTFEKLVVTAPAPQGARLLASVSEFAARLDAVGGIPCWSVMLAFERAVPVEADLIWPTPERAIALAMRDSAKTGRASGERWVLQAHQAWSRTHLEDQRDAVAPALLAAFGELLADGLPEPTFAAAHRWRYAFPARPLGEPCLWDAQRRVGACGDFCLGGDVESAWLSGRALADRLLVED
jgi:predicted NAD/FAD-dependent oxidoreductase